ncbi:Coenzyme A disulfide reductase [Pseudobythopirellula maris]|uniref:Coenzyme A disulfide reductase n=1 Tax=Pseudobythopirellula maris TaxID=2527991 RepID=A0A5C5ZNG3_9BACT|nr:FAD-dependent oxidoreductase [Pseudobythopirellula maris]TWT88381.1 Coenzyme A disulfide reductase [Pseudobythopirellula maris]
MKVVIIGAVAGGASAAARARRLDESAEIVLIERGADPSFANCGMPYYIGGEIESREKLIVTSAGMLHDRYRLDVRVRQEALRIDRQAKTVRVRRLENGAEYDESYDKLILSPGAAPIRPELPGIDHPKVYTLRNLDDADLLHAATMGAKRAVIVGGGFIGVEMAENLVRRGVETTLIERNDQILTPWDAEMVAPAAAALRSAGVTLKLGAEAEAFEPQDDGGVTVALKSGEQLSADFVVMCIGVRPENALAKAAGLAIGERGGIRVDETMRTDDPDIYAVGDAVETFDSVTGKPTQIPLAGPANRQGRIAADNCFGRESRYRGTQGTAIVGACGVTAAMTGLSEKACRRLGVAFEKVYVHPASNAGYYPGAEGMTLKLVFDPENGRVLGAQGVGGKGVDKRIDVLAMALQAGMTVYDLEESELCYAPQYGSAKDPVNMLGFVAAGLLRGDHPVEHAHRLLDCELGDSFVLDVRSPGEHAAGAVPGATNINIDELRERLGELPKDRRIVAYCKVGMRGYLATRLLRQHGFDAVNLSGGFTKYERFVAARAEATPKMAPSGR